MIGIKKKVENNSKQISINKDTSRKIIQPIMGILSNKIPQARLAEDKITVDEHDKLKFKLD